MRYYKVKYKDDYMKKLEEQNNEKSIEIINSLENDYNNNKNTDGLNSNTTKDSKWIRCVSPVGTLYNSFNEDRSIEGLVPAFCMEL